MNETLTNKIRQPLNALPYLIFKYLHVLFKVFGIFLVLELFRLFTNDDYKLIKLFFLLAVFIVITILLALKEYIFLYYQIKNHQLIIHNGFIKKSKTVIPLKKIQNITTKSNWLQKLLGVTSIIIDTAGSEKEEAEFIIKAKDIEDFKNIILLNTNAEIPVTTGLSKKTVPTKKAYTYIFETRTIDILKLGLSANHLETLLIAATFIFSQLQDLKKYFQESIESLSNTSSSIVEQNLHTAWGIIVLVFALLVLTIIFSILRSLLKYFDFKISKTDNGFYLKYGLLSNIEKIVPNKKIQMIQWSANALRLKLKLYEFKFLTTGDDDQNKKLKTYIPITQIALLNTLAKDYCAPTSFHSNQKTVIQKQYIFITLLLKIIPLIFIILLIAFILHLAFLYLLVLPAYWGFKSILKQKKSYLQFHEDGVLFNEQSFGLKVQIVRWDKLQTLCFQQSRFQKKNKLATLKLNSSAGNISIPYITVTEAEQLYNLGIYKMETTEWR